MAVHFQIACCFYRQIHEAMLRQQGQHMIQKADAGNDVTFPLAVKIQLYRDPGLRCLPFNSGAARLFFFS